MARGKFSITVDRSGRGRTLTITKDGQPIGVAGVQPGNVSRATIRKREQPEDFVLPKQAEVEDAVEEVNESEVTAERLRSSGQKPPTSSIEGRMSASIAEKLSRMRR